jgi:hypothetical protein
LHSGDNVLKQLGEMLLERKLFKVKLQESPFNVGEITSLKEKVSAQLKVNMEEAGFFVSSGEISNAAYLIGGKKNKSFKKIRRNCRCGRCVGLAKYQGYAQNRQKVLSKLA